MNASRLSAANDSINRFKMYLATILLVLSCLVPLAGFWVAKWHLPVAIKSLIIGLLTIGTPELLTLIAVAVIGKSVMQSILANLKTSLAHLFDRCFVLLANRAVPPAPLRANKSRAEARMLS